MSRITVPESMLNACYRPFLLDEHRVQIYFGGAASGKSVFLATRCALDTLRGRNTLIVRNVARTLRASCWNEVLKSIDRMGMRELFAIGKTDGVITARNNGAQMLFAGLDDPEKIKSITPERGALTDVWIEEATETRREHVRQLDKRLRGQSPHKKRLTLSFNPILRSHWLYKEYFGGFPEGGRLYQDERLTILKTTHRDNRFLTDGDREALESEQDEYFHRVYTLGEWGDPGGAIFTNWRACDLAGMKETLDQPLYGLDFGFSSDPCGAVCAHVDRGRGVVYVLGELCERGLTNAALAGRLRAFLGNAYVRCDSSEPKSIAELREHGISALPAKKGPDSVSFSIQWLRGQEIVVDARCLNMQRELAAYQWLKDKNGDALRVPRDRDNHLIDALRYALEDEMSARRAVCVDRRAIPL